MKRSWLTFAVLTTAILAAPTWADDTHHQAMKDCVARQKAQNSTMSADDIKKACKDETKAKGDHAPGADTPNPTTTTT